MLKYQDEERSFFRLVRVCRIVEQTLTAIHPVYNTARTPAMEVGTSWKIHYNTFRTESARRRLRMTATRTHRRAGRVNIPTDRPAARTHRWWAVSVTITGRKRRGGHDNVRTNATSYVPAFYVYYTGNRCCA